MGMTLEGLDQLVRNCDNLVTALQSDKAKEIFLKAGTLVRDEAKQIVEVYDGPARTDVTPGELRDAIFVAPGPDELPNVVVGVNLANVDYALDVEFGNGFQAGQSYLRAARDNKAAEVLEILASELQGLIEDTVK